MIGLTDEVLSKIKKRQKRKDHDITSTSLYQAASTMKDYHLSPREWRRLSSFDQKVLIYTRMMEQHYQDVLMEEAEPKREREQRQKDMMSNMPKQIMPRRK